MLSFITKSVSKVFLTFSLCLVLFGAAPARAVEIVLATAEEMQGIDVQQINWEYLPHELIYEPLFHLDPKTNAFVPAAASAWKITDKNELIFTVPRDGRKFSNGAPFTPEAVKASFERFIKISPYTDDMAAVTSIKVEGDDVIFVCDSSPVPAMVSISTGYGGIVDVTEAEEKGDEAVKSGIATFGPFKVDEWVQGSHLRIVPNKDFKTFNPMVENKGPLDIEAVTVRFIPDSFTRVQELQAGNVDVIYNVPSERVETLKNDPNIELYAKSQTGADILYIQPEAEGLTDPKVRLAVLRAVDRKELVTALNGHAEERYGILAPSMIGFSKEFEEEAAKNYSYDPQEAAKLLDEAGYKMGEDGVRAKGGEKLDFEFLVPFDMPTLKKMAPVIQSQLKKVGINLNIREFEDQYVKQAARDRKNRISMRHYIWPDGDMLTWLAHTDSGYFNYPDVDKLVEAGRESADPEVRAKTYAVAERAIMDKGIIVPLVSNIDYTAYRKNLKGIVFTALFTFLNDAKKD
jgi:peptide/nickel transport system substrate-binding protein